MDTIGLYTVGSEVWLERHNLSVKIVGVAISQACGVKVVDTLIGRNKC